MPINKSFTSKRSVLKKLPSQLLGNLNGRRATCKHYACAVTSTILCDTWLTVKFHEHFGLPLCTYKLQSLDWKESEWLCISGFRLQNAIKNLPTNEQGLLAITTRIELLLIDRPITMIGNGTQAIIHQSKEKWKPRNIREINHPI